MPSVKPASAEGWSTAAYVYQHLIVGLGFNTRIPVDYNLLRWLLDAPRGRTADRDGLTWLWKQLAGSYCLLVASVHPIVNEWISRGRDDAEDPHGLIGVREWFDDTIWGAGKTGLDSKMLDDVTVEDVIAKIAWLETEPGRKVVQKVWETARRHRSGVPGL
jgi:hypothetical protein